MTGAPKQIVYGSNYIETLILTLTNLELSNPRLYYYTTKRLEEELLAMGIAYKQILNTYKKYVIENFKSKFPQLPLPELKRDSYLEEIIEHLRKHQHRVIENIETWSEKEIESKILQLALSIVRPSILATFYKIGVIKVSHR